MSEILTKRAGALAALIFKAYHSPPSHRFGKAIAILFAFPPFKYSGMQASFR